MNTKKTALTCACGADDYAARAASETAVEYNVTGNVRLADGRPATGAVVFFKEHPSLCAVARANGRFEIRGRRSPCNPVLLASATACEPAETVIRSRTTKNVKIVLHPQPVDFTMIEVGGAWQATKIRAKDFNYVPRPMTDDMRECIDVYNAFRKAKGAKILEKLLAGEPLDDDEKPYRFLLWGEIGGYGWYGAGRGLYPYPGPLRPEYARHYKRYTETLAECAGMLKDRGYTGKKMSESDIELLRQCMAMNGAINSLYHFNYYPPRDTWAGEHRIGGSLPDVRMIPIESVFSRPEYTDYPSLSLTEAFRLEGLGSLLMNLGSWEEKPGGKFSPKPVAAVEAENPRPGYTYRKLSASTGKKPVFLFYFTMEERAVTDWYIWWKHWFHAYGKDVEFIFIARPASWAGDVRMDKFAYFGENPGVDPKCGLATRWGEIDWTPERLARAVKLGFMERPYLPAYNVCLEEWGFPCSTLFHPHYHPHGPHVFILADKNGVMDTSMNYYHIGGNWWVGQSYNCPFNMWDLPLHFLSPVELDIRALVANNGLHDSGSVQRRRRPDLPSRMLWGNEDQRPPFIIKSIDKKSGIITATLDDEKAGGVYLFACDKSTRTVLRKTVGGREVYRHVAWTKLPVGSPLFPDVISDERLPELFPGGVELQNRDYPAFDISKYRGKTLRAVRLLGFRPFWLGSRSIQEIMVLSGTIESIGRHEITVAMRRPTEKEYPGLGYWKKSRGKADPAGYVFDLDRGAERILPVMERWSKSPEKTIRYKFRLDAAVRIIRNGENDLPPESLQKADCVTVAYPMWYETQGEWMKPLFPEIILASSRI